MELKMKLSGPKYAPETLVNFATSLLNKAGLPLERASVVAETLTASDLMGHTTHGLQLLPGYVRELEKEMMAVEGFPTVVRDLGSAITWDGHYLPGPWLVHRALDLLLERKGEYPVVTMVIRKSHHIACLATFLERATDKGLMLILASSDPANKTVAPFGGIHGVYSPDPIAVGIPTLDDPVLIDISTSATANGVVYQKYKNGEKLPHPWLLDVNGEPTDDPARLFDSPPATMMPLGGLDTGYKGFSLGLMIEAMTLALGGFGRANEPDRWTSGVFLQLLNPDAFGGINAFIRETTHLTHTCRQTATKPGEPPVRIPGDRARQLRDWQTKNGLHLYPTIMPRLEELAKKYGIVVPKEI